MFIRKFLSLMLSACCLMAYASDSRLAQGKWVKIKVTKEGIHQISYEKLSEWGFSDPSSVSVYGYGGTALALERIGAGTDDIAPTASMHTADKRLLFYGDADLRFDLRGYSGTETTSNPASENGTFWRRNIYDDGGYYFLSDCNTPYGIPTVDAPAEGAGTEDAYTGHMHVDVRDTDAASLLGKGAIFFEKYFTGSDSYTIPVELTDWIDSETEGGTARPARVVYTVYIPSDAGNITGSQVIENIGGDIAAYLTTSTPAAVSRFNSSDWAMCTGSSSYSRTAGAPSRVAGKLTLLRPAAAKALQYAFDRYAVIYPRLNRLAAGEAQMVLNYPTAVGGCPIVISDCGDDMHLWDVSDPAAVRELAMRLSADGTAMATMPETFSAAKPGRLLLFDAAAQLPEPEYAGEVAPQNLHACEVPEMAIITTDALAPYARLLAEAHERADGMKVGVFLNREIQNEFASGGNTPMAYRRFARMLHDRAPGTFRYVLLLGPSHWDHRGVTRANPTERLAVYECYVPDARGSEPSAYANDAFVGCLDDFTYLQNHNAEMTVAVGRIPAANEGDAANMVGHIIDYIDNPPTAAAFRKVLMSSATGDKYEHYLYSEDMAAILESSDGGFVVNRVPMIAYPRNGNKNEEANNRLAENLAEGRGLFAFFGHSSSQGNSLGTAFYSNSVAQSLNYDVAPVSFLATCNAFAFDTDLDCIAPVMLAKRGGGAIGVVGASRSVYSDYNKELGLYLARSYSAAKPGTTVGELFMDAHNMLLKSSKSSPLHFNVKCFNLAGDPAVRLPIGDARATLDAVNGTAALSAEPVKELSAITLSGNVLDADGNVDTAFNGTAEVVLYDTPRAGTVVNRDATATKHPDITITNSRLTSTSVNVRNGAWEASVFVPSLSNPGRNMAATVDAQSADGRAAHAYITDIATAAGSDSDPATDPSPAEITEMYIGTPDFNDGDNTGTDITLYARIAVPASGINISSSPLSGASRIVLDGASSAAISGYLRPAAEGDASEMLLAMPYTGLAEGRHEIALEVSNNLGATTSRTVSFTANAPASASLAVEERPARTAATFAVNHTLGSEAQATIIIDTADGRTVRTLAGTSEWNLNDADGRPVADGVYRAYALVRDGLRSCHTAPVEVIVLRAAAQ